MGTFVAGTQLISAILSISEWLEPGRKDEEIRRGTRAELSTGMDKWLLIIYRAYKAHKAQRAQEGVDVGAHDEQVWDTDDTSAYTTYGSLEEPVQNSAAPKKHPKKKPKQQVTFPRIPMHVVMMQIIVSLLSLAGGIYLLTIGQPDVRVLAGCWIGTVIGYWLR